MKSFSISVMTAAAWMAGGLFELSAAPITWDGSADANWQTAENWDAAFVSGNTTDVVFNAPGAGNPGTFLGSSAAVTVRSLSFNDHADGDLSITFRQSIGGTNRAFNLTADSGNASISIAAGAAANISLNEAGGTLNIGSNLLVDHDGSGVLSLKAIGGSGFSITKSGTGEMALLGGNSTFSGGLVINGGTVRANSANTATQDLGATGSTVTLGGGRLLIENATWAGNKAYTNIYNLTAAPDTTSTLEYFNSSATARILTFAGASYTLTLSGNLTTKSLSTQGANVISLTLGATTGAGTLSHEGNNDFSSGYSDRRLQIGTASNAGWTGPVEARRGYVLFTNQTTSGDLRIGVDGSPDPAAIGFSSVGDATFANAVRVRAGHGLRVFTTQGANIGNSTWSGDWTLDGALTFDAASTAGTDTISGDLSGDGGLIKKGARPLTLSGTNSHAGGTTVVDGTLLLAGGHALPDAGAIILAGGTLNTQGGAETAGPLIVSGNAILEIGSGSGTLALADSSAEAWTGTLTLSGTLGATSVRFGTSSGALTPAQLARITSGGQYFELDANGYLKTLSALSISNTTTALTGDNQLADNKPVVLDSGTLDLDGYSDTVGVLDVLGDSTIVLNGGAIAFADSAAIPWGHGIISISGTLGATSVRFGTSDNALTMVQQSLLRVNGKKARLDANGYVKVINERTDSGFQVIGYSRVSDTWGTPVVNDFTYYDPVTELIFSGLKPVLADGSLSTTQFTPQNHEHLMAAKKSQEGMRVTVSVLGDEDNGDGTGFAMVADPVKRAALIENLRQFILANGFDGVDYDWEYVYLTDPPIGPDGLQNYYVALLQETKAAFAPYELVVTVATNSWLNGAPLNTLYAAADRVHDMAYSTLDASYRSLLRYETQRGTPREKLAVGVPFYSKDTDWKYRNIITSDEVTTKPEPWNNFYFKDAAPSTTFYFNNLDLIKLQTKTLLDSGTGGIMIWDLLSDYWERTHPSYPPERNLSLLNAIGEAIAEWVPTPVVTQNPGFDVMLEGWETKVTAGAATVTLDTTSALSGPFSAKAQITTPGAAATDIRFSQVFEVESGKNYTLRFRVKSGGTTGNLPVSIIEFSHPPNEYGPTLASFSAPFSGTASSHTFSYTAASSRAVRFVFDLGQLPAGTVLYLDDAAIQTALTVGAGGYTLAGDNLIAGTLPLTLDGGTLTTAGFSDSFSTLQVDGTSSIDISGGGGLTFADSSATPWTGTLTITGPLAPKTIRFGTSASGLTSTQLDRIVLPNGGHAALDTDGFLEIGILTPTDLAGALLWLDAKDAASLTASGGFVSSWQNKANTGNNAVQATASRQPSLIAAGIHGHPAVQFDGNDDRLAFSAALDTTPGEFHAFTVVSGPQAGTNNYERILGTSSATSSYTWDMFRPADGRIGKPFEPVVLSQYSTSNVTIENLNLAASGTGTNRFAGFLGEVVIYNRILTFLEKAALFDYLNTRWSIPATEPAYNVATSPTLRNLGGSTGIVLAGGVKDFYNFTDLPVFLDVLTTHFNGWVPINDFKMALVRPNSSTFDFTKTDQHMAQAQANGMEVRGHVLVWHTTVPTWVTNGGFTPAQMETIMNTHIDGMVGQYAGEVAIWDVVNEAFLVTGALRSTLWSAIDSLPGGYPGSYIDKAFVRARAADPDARLILNDFDAETLNEKSDALYAFVQGMLARGVPIDGVGFQMHIDVFGLDYDSLLANLQRFSDLGLEIHITEMDVNIPELVTQEMLDRQAEVYRNVLAAALQVPNFRSLTVWGISDLRQNSINRPGYYKALLTDETYQLKPAYQALREALQTFAIADSDGDSHPTLWEVLTGTDPFDAGSFAASTPQIFDLSGSSYLGISFPFLDSGAANLTIQGSNTLMDWTDLDTTPGTGNAISTESNGILTIRQTTPFGSPGAFRFLRAMVQPHP